MQTTLGAITAQFHIHEWCTHILKHAVALTHTHAHAMGYKHFYTTFFFVSCYFNNTLLI